MRKEIFSCARCNYKSHRRGSCPTCGFPVEEECPKCRNAKGNCVCRIRGRR